MSSDPIPSRLANLPGYDTAAPDIYETTDDTTSTFTAQTSPPLPSEPSETSDEESADGEAGSDEEEGVGILSRRRLYPERARRRFGEESRGLGSKGVDLSDRVDGKRRGYRVRRRSADVGVEGLSARIARLKREVEEVRVLAERERDVEAGAEEDEEDGGRKGQAEELGRLLAGVEAPTASAQRRAKVVRTSSGTPGAWPEQDTEGESEEQTLRRVADFDTRLSALEQALGFQSLFDSTNTNAVSTPLLPTLTLLDQQLAALSSSTSLTNLEAASARISKLRSQAEASLSRPTSSSGDSDTSALTPEDLIKLQALYTLLPTLQSLSPTVPALLTRLHSLRTLHTSAANAAGELGEVEKRQAEMESELKAWREGLEKVEQAVVEASEANGRNGKVVEGWVRELEGRMKKLGR
jgi:nuclear migration protein JNM1